MITPEQKREIVDRITKEFADRGVIMEGGWQALLAVGIPPEATDLQKAEMRKVFFFGAQHLFASIMGILDPGTEPTDKDLERVTLIYKELERFTQEMKNELS